MKTPFDSLCVTAALQELEQWKGARVQKVLQPGPLDVVVELYAGKPVWFLLSADPRYARCHLLTRKPTMSKEPPPFCAELRKRLTDSRFAVVRQRGLDRIAEFGFESKDGDWLLVAELMGKHSNLILCETGGRMVAAAKWVGPRQSVRRVLPGKTYEPPPFEPKPSLLEAKDGDDLEGFEGVSPFVRKLIEAGVPLATIQDAFRGVGLQPHYFPGGGAYPMSLEALGGIGVARESYSQCAEQAFAERIEREATESLRANLRTQLERTLSGRERALADIEKALDAASRARQMQTQAELILAYQAQAQPGASVLHAWDYEGNSVEIALQPDLSAKDNALKLFDRAKRAKARAGEVLEMHDRLLKDRDRLLEALEKLRLAEGTEALEMVRVEADRAKWLRQQAALRPEERPYQGKRVRELLSPGGWKVMYGENAEANDHLTMRVAKPNDYWLHIRGGTSAHVVLATLNKPDKVQKADLVYAAEVAVRNSPSKHAGLVAVDCTLRRYVRKPKGSAAGFAVYTHERTLHVEAAR